MTPPSPTPPGPRPRRISPARFTLFLAGAVVLVLLVFHRDFIQSIREPELLISEIMAVNRSTLADSDGDFSEWIEIHNPQTKTQSLAGWFLTDDFRALRKWSFPDVELEPGGFIVVFASGKDRRQTDAELHTNFRLGRKGEYLALIQPDGRTVAHEYLPKYPPMDDDISFGLRPQFFAPGRAGEARRNLRQHAFFVTPTPGGPNEAEMLGRIAPVRANPSRGFQSTPFPLSLASSTPGSEIWFTTNGSIPAPGIGTRYSQPIPIAHPTVVRAAGFRPGFKPSDIATFTFLFPGQVARQDGNGFPIHWGVRNDLPVIADYAMDPEITDNPRYAERFNRSLGSLPTLSLVIDPSDLFDPATGIYSNPTESGGEWERPASLELLNPDGSRGFQANCGARIQGGWSRRPEESPKHSFRIEFRARHGTSHLRQPLLGPDGPSRFRSLILRAGCNNSWLHWSPVERRRGDLLRDPFMRDAFRDLGQPSAQSRFFHLHLNGLYWGIYNASERPDDSFLAEHLGGTPEDYESRNADHVLAGSDAVWNRIFELANAGLEDSGRYTEFIDLVDLDNFCAFMLVQIYGGTSDWDAASNWYAGRRSRPSGKYQFFIWDSERSLEEIDANILSADDDQCPTRLFQALRRNPQFRAAFKVVARKHLGPGGALAPEASIRRYAALADTLRPAMVAESARWGDYRRDVHPYKEGPYELHTVDDHWEPEVQRLLNRYFPARTREVIRQLGEADLH